MPKMTHPLSKQTLDVAANLVEIYESQGWRPKPAKPAVK